MSSGRLTPRKAAKIIIYIELYWRQNGHGPLWREIAKFAGWWIAGRNAPAHQKRAYERRFQELVPYGFRFEPGVPHSAHVTEEGLAAALEFARAARGAAQPEELAAR